MAKEGPFTDVPDSDDGGDEGETEGGAADMHFDVLEFFQASTAAIDFLLSFAKALAASACATA